MKKSKRYIVVVDHNHLVERNGEVFHFRRGGDFFSVFARCQKLNVARCNFRAVLFLALLVRVNIHVEPSLYVDEVADAEPSHTDVGKGVPCLHAKVVDGIVAVFVLLEALTNGNRKMDDAFSVLRFVLVQLCCDATAEDDAVQLNFLPFVVGRFGAVSGFPF